MMLFVYFRGDALAARQDHAAYRVVARIELHRYEPSAVVLANHEPGQDRPHISAVFLNCRLEASLPATERTTSVPFTLTAT